MPFVWTFSFSCSNNLYKHYRTFTDHRSQQKTVAKLQGGHRFISRQGLKPLANGNSEFENFSKESSLVMSQFIYEKCKKRAGETRKAAVKNEFIELCDHIFRTFPSLPKEIALSSSPCLRSHSSVRDSTCGQLLPSSLGRWFPQFLDVRNAKKSLLEQLIIDNNSLACEAILSWCGGNVFKRTLMPIRFVKRKHFWRLTWDLFPPSILPKTESTPF